MLTFISTLKNLEIELFDFSQAQNITFIQLILHFQFVRVLVQCCAFLNVKKDKGMLKDLSGLKFLWETREAYLPLHLTLFFDRYPNPNDSMADITIFGMELDL